MKVHGTGAPACQAVFRGYAQCELALELDARPHGGDHYSSDGADPVVGGQVIWKEAVVDYLVTGTGKIRVQRCPACNAWDWALQGEPGTATGPSPGEYSCEECGCEFEVSA